MLVSPVSNNDCNPRIENLISGYWIKKLVIYRQQDPIFGIRLTD